MLLVDALHVVRVEEKAQVSVLVHRHCVQGHRLVQHAEEVGEDCLQVQRVDREIRLALIAEVHFFQSFTHQALDLLTRHRAKVERREHVLGERISVLEEDIDFLAEGVVDD